MAESGVCTSCGAALPAADALGLITCPGCGQVTKLPGSSPTHAPEPVVPPVMPPLQGWPAPPVAAPPPGGQWAAPAPVAGAPPVPAPVTTGRRSKAAGGDPARTGRRIGCSIVPLVIIAVVGFSIFGAVRSCDVDGITSNFNKITSAFSSDSTLSGSGVVLPSTGGDVEMVAVIQQSENSDTTRRIGRISFRGDSSKLLWQSEVLDDSAYRAEIAVVGNTMFAGVDDQLYALDATTGATIWKTTLRDKLTSGCSSCFAAAGGRLVVRTTDAYVTAYGPKSAESIWDKRLTSTSGSISVVGDRLFLVDEPEDASAAVTPVSLIDPANGKVIKSTTPACPKSDSTPWDLEMSPGDEVRAVPGSKDVMAVFGFGDTCVVRWDPATGATKWTSRLTGLGSLNEDAIVVGERDLVVANSSGQLVTVYLPNGKARLLETAGDMVATPSEIVGRTLVALTTTTRGTPKGGLAGWDLSSGKRLWANASLGNAQPVSTGGYHPSDALFDGSPRSLVVPADGGVNVFVFEGTERTFTVAPVDLATGELGTKVRRAFLTRYDSGTPSITIEGQTGDRLMVSMDSLLQAIPISGKGPLVSYPEKH